MALVVTATTTAQPNMTHPATRDSHSVAFHVHRAHVLFKRAYAPSNAQPQRELIDKAQAHRQAILIRDVRLQLGVFRDKVRAKWEQTHAFGSLTPPGEAWLASTRQCESGGNYATNTGNGFYGAYQFDLGTWQSVGGSGLPSDASPAEQDYRAAVLYRARGSSPWPVCG